MWADIITWDLYIQYAGTAPRGSAVEPCEALVSPREYYAFVMTYDQRCDKASRGVQRVLSVACGILRAYQFALLQG